MAEKKDKLKKLKDEEMLKVKGNTNKGDPVASSYYDGDEQHPTDPPGGDD